MPMIINYLLKTDQNFYQEQDQAQVVEYIDNRQGFSNALRIQRVDHVKQIQAVGTRSEQPCYKRMCMLFSSKFTGASVLHGA